MASSNSINLAKSLSKPQEKLPIGEYGGRVRVLKDSFLMSAIINNGDEIAFEFLPEGAKIIDAEMRQDKTLGAGCTLQLGLKAYSDQDGSAVSEASDSLIAAAAATSSQKLQMANEAGYGSEIGSGKAQVFATIAGANTTATDALIEILVKYIVA